MITDDFWQLAYIAQLNNSALSVAEHRAEEAVKAADLATLALEDFIQAGVQE